MIDEIQALLADKAYDEQEQVLNLLAEAGVQAVISAKSNCKEQHNYDHDLSKARHLIEICFAKLKQFRAIAIRSDQRAMQFFGTI